MNQTHKPPTPHPTLAGVYVLLAGLVGGLLLGPMVLGHFNAQMYQGLFPNPTLLKAKRNDITRTRKVLEQTDVTYVAMQEFDQQRQAELDAIESGLDQTQWTQSLMQALILGALTCLMVMNLTDRNGGLFGRLHLGAHVALAMWLSLFVAQPYLIATLPTVGLLLPIAIGVLLCLSLVCTSSKSQPHTEESDVAR
ncbi:MAG TPA: hypothetical protein DCM28_19995 [Phycisphaerales bacterium]|nr:hypothetical protein [Phycisphaerales bacterium]HCD32968.1 hypothetical protein [Phycisphaerales bacterium]|tara:strand:- start:106 stop:690 length:585 start_codon:yes stop_codon:yes gene_type:complete